MGEVVTGAEAYAQYGFESAFNTVQSNRNKVMGIEQKITGLTYNENMQTLSGLYEVEPSQFSFLATNGRYNVDFILSNPWFIQAIFDNATPENGGFTFTPTPRCKSISQEIGIKSDSNVVRVATGVLMNSFSLRANVDDMVRMSAEMIYGKEEDLSSSINSSIAHDDQNFPYTFAHGTVKLPNTVELAEIQSVELTVNQNAELLKAVGKHNPVAGIRKRLDVTGRFNITLKDGVNYGYVKSRSQVATMELTFTNGLSGSAEKLIQFIGTGIGLSEHQVGSIEPHQTIFEDVSFTWLKTKVFVKNGATTIP